MRLLEATADPGSMAEVVGWLGRQGLSQAEGRSLWATFVRRSEDRGAHYGVRAHALHGAMLAAQDERGLLRRLQGTLIDLDRGGDARFLRHAARIAGAVLAHEPDDGLRDLLRDLAAIDGCADEAAMELGLDAVRAGFVATGTEAALAAFREARRWFSASGRASEARVDAELYGLCLDVLVGFAEGGGPGIGELLDGVRAAAFRHAALIPQSDRHEASRSWLGLTQVERTHWSLLAMRLGALDASLASQPWLHAAAVIEDELLQVYAASRSIFRRSDSGGLETLLRPRVVGALRRERIALDFLDRWILENAGSPWIADAALLRAEVAAARERAAVQRPSDAVSGNPTVAALLERAGVPEPVRRGALARIQANVLALTDETVSRVVADRFEEVAAGMARNGHYARYPDAADFFDIVLWFTTLFAVSRHDLSASSLPRTGYLFDRGPTPPRERTLQQDFHDFLMGSPLAAVCRAEARDLGGGRVDILFTRGWIRTVAELKRIFTDRPADGLLDEFGLQAASYAGTNVAFGVLMVLDLYDRGGAQPPVVQQVSLHHRRPEWSWTEHAVALFRIQGRRLPPSRQ
ncbi:hypothetical protein [Methylobacterium sp.]|uniref:hypothetical protein n=1 Tax=Methylobacterium sp. TaxID=409 RepID=UPI003B027306